MFWRNSVIQGASAEGDRQMTFLGVFLVQTEEEAGVGPCPFGALNCSNGTEFAQY